MGFPQKLLAQDERLVLVLRRHVKVLLGPLVVLLITAGVGGMGIGLVPDGQMQPWLRLGVGAVAGFIILRWSIWPFVVWWNTLYAITTRRLVLREGVLSRKGHDMPLVRLNDVSFSHSFIDRLLGCGTLVVESAGERGQLLLDDIPKVELVQRTLYRLADEAREPGRRGRDDVDDDLERDLDAEFDEEYVPDPRPRRRMLGRRPQPADDGWDGSDGSDRSDRSDRWDGPDTPDGEDEPRR
jgi:uncharacterized membrane protein YdbT with pleckstrin-like domain